MSNLVGKKAAVKMFHDRGLSIATSEEMVAGLPRYTDGKRKKYRTCDIEKRLEELLTPATVETKRQGHFTERNIRGLYGK